MLDEKSTGQILEKLREAVESIKRRDSALDDIKSEQSRQADEQARQAETLQAIQLGLAEQHGADHDGELKDLKDKLSGLRADLLEPDGVVDKLRMEGARRSGSNKTWAVLGSVLGAVGTILGILAGLKII